MIKKNIKIIKEEKTKGINPSFIFNKKVKKIKKTNSYNIVDSTSGITRIFPSANREWYNSIYAYNKESLKNISIKDKILIRLIKSYLSLYLGKKLLNYNVSIPNKSRRFSPVKIFVGKPELKHTSSKVKIILYTYNEQRRSLDNEIKELINMICPSKERKLYLKKNNLSLNLDWLKNGRFLLLFKRKWYYLLYLKKKLILNSSSANAVQENLNEYLKYEQELEKLIKISEAESELIQISSLLLKKNLSLIKLDSDFISRLNPLISKIYNKDIEIQVVNLKTLYFNSHIFTEAIATKARNRSNGILKILKYALKMVVLPNVNSIREKYNKININDVWANKIVNWRNRSNLSSNMSNISNLNTLLVNLLPYFYINKDVSNLKTSKKYTSTLLDYVVNSLNYKKMAGIRLEAKGRLTRRFTASRSLFKIKWKGNLKNFDSSYRGLSAVILRGHLKSNVQYSLSNSKTKNGAFGIKGWISGK